ncbi:hypothetical protein [Arenimonas sp.]|uniref:hypothetical protein n=1 Tax=Arenimonas sp. TaxID=1872635 RepID=UPI0035B45499
MANASVNLTPRDLEKIEVLLQKIRGVTTVMSTSDSPPDYEDIKWVAFDLSEKCTDALEILTGQAKD